MSLEQKFRKKFILHRTPSEDVSNEIKQGKKFIVVDENFNGNVPLGYMLIDMKYSRIICLNDKRTKAFGDLNRFISRAPINYNDFVRNRTNRGKTLSQILFFVKNR